MLFTRSEFLGFHLLSSLLTHTFFTHCPFLRPLLTMKHKSYSAAQRYCMREHQLEPNEVCQSWVAILQRGFIVYIYIYFICKIYIIYTISINYNIRLVTFNYSDYNVSFKPYKYSNLSLKRRVRPLIKPTESSPLLFMFFSSSIQQLHIFILLIVSS